jgi:hypothetical protein
MQSQIAHPGRIWSPDDQCKMIYGASATFCQSLSSQVCTSIACRLSASDVGCRFVNGNGAVEGTICESGHVCQSGVCAPSHVAPIGECLFGDDVIVNLQVITDPLPTNQMQCEDVFAYLETRNQFPIIYCNIPLFRKTCCNTCKSKGEKRF